MERALLIPIYEPGVDVLPFLSSFQKGEFETMLVVDDGSGEKYTSVFAEIEKSTPFSVLSYPKNQGKGYALRTGMKKILADHPHTEFIVTADGDGQHAKEDILHIRDEASLHPDALTLGTRDFSSMPAKSQSGNKWAAFYYRFLTGKRLSDTQTGLRAIPSFLFPLALATGGDHYEYEMNFLVAAGRQASLHSVTIQTIYLHNNEGSHFRPVRDSLRIAKVPIASAIVGLVFYGIDLLFYGLLVAFAFPNALTSTLPNLYAYLIAGGVVFLGLYFLLEHVVFQHKWNMGNSLWKYALLSLISIGVGFGLSEAIKGAWPNLLGIKAVFDILLGLIKYVFDRFFIFLNWGKKKSKKR